MSFFKRAMTSIMRRPGKSVILLLLVFILGTVIAGAIAVHGAVGNTDANLRRGMRPLVSLQADHEAHSQFWEENGYTWEDPDAPQIMPLTLEMVREIGELPYVQNYEYSVPAWLNDVPGIRRYDLWRDEEDTSPVGDDEMAWGLNFRGTSETELLQVRENAVELVDGRTFTESELSDHSDVVPVIVSAGLARVNSWDINDRFEIYQRMVFPQPDGMWDQHWGVDPDNIFAEEALTFEIIGLIDVPGGVEEIDLNDMSMENQQRINRLDNVLGMIHLPNVAAEEMQRFEIEQRPLMLEHMVENDMELPEWMQQFGSEQESLDDEADQLHITSIILLNDPDEVEPFTEAAKEILPDFWRVEGLSGGFDAISSSMETLQGIAFWVLWASVITTLLILSLLITLFLRDRRYEMGVYLALGEKKGKIISQILLEVVVTSVVGITLAVFTGNIISGIMSRNMLRNEITAEQNTSNNEWTMHWNEFDMLGMSTDMAPEDMLEAFDISLNVETIGLFYAVGLGAVVLSTVAPVIYVVTLNPKKVLM